MLEFNGDHYKLIKYDDKSRFEFQDIPMLIKYLVARKLTKNWSSNKNDDISGYTYEFADYIKSKKVTDDIVTILADKNYINNKFQIPQYDKVF
jgi:hypothetical protein